MSTTRQTAVAGMFYPDDPALLEAMIREYLADACAARYTRYPEGLASALEKIGEFWNRRARVAFNFQVEFRGEANCSEHAHRIFPVARLGVSDDAKLAILQIGQTAAIVNYFLTRRIVEQRINSEITTYGIFFAATEHIVTQNAPMFIGSAALTINTGVFTAERGNLHNLTAT